MNIPVYIPKVLESDLQDALLEYVANREMGVGGDMISLGYGLDRRPVEWLLGQLKSCEDVIPDLYSKYLGLPSQATYADVVQILEIQRTGGDAIPE